MSSKSLLFTIPARNDDNQNPVLLRVCITKEFTKVDFGYSASWYYEKGGWIDISPKTFLELEDSKERHVLEYADGIPISPDKHHFESTKDWKYFSLYFTPIPIKDCIINIIEAENSNSDDFNYYGIELLIKDSDILIEET